MEVVEDEHERLRRCQPFEQLSHGSVDPVALALESDGVGASEVRKRREDPRELRPHLLGEVAEATRLGALHVLVERLDEHPEGDVALEVRGRAPEHDVPARVGASGDLGQEPRLADPGGAHHLDGARSAGRQPVEGVVEPPELVLAAYEGVCDREDEPSDDLRVLPRCRGARRRARWSHAQPPPPPRRPHEAPEATAAGALRRPADGDPRHHGGQRRAARHGRRPRASTAATSAGRSRATR